MLSVITGSKMEIAFHSLNRPGVIAAIRGNTVKIRMT